MDIQSELDALKSKDLYRERTLLNSAQGLFVNIAGKKLLNFCSNDYLGLANEPRTTKAFIAAAKKFGVGAGASQLVCGYQRPHFELEEALAEFLGDEKALLFSNGYLANIGVLQSLVGRNDLVLLDKLNHASTIDAAKLSGAQIKRFRHLAPSEIVDFLKPLVDTKKIIISDSVFSMDGDMADVIELKNIADITNSLLLIDDAHGFGVLGENGGGVFDIAENKNAKPDFYLATLGKALGCYGAFISGKASMIDYLIQKSRTLIYTTAPPAAIAAAAKAALEIVKNESERRLKLTELIEYFCSSAKQLNLPIKDSKTAIQALIIGDNKRAVLVSQMLKEKNILATAIRPPTVPVHSARIRITLTAKHEKSHVDELLEAINNAMGVMKR